jgi:hypothetical protein
MIKPIAVLSGDIHYSLSTLELADKATRMAINKANELNVPFIANGDTHDSKANLRGECVNAMIKTFNSAKLVPYVNIGNHCKINERSNEHSLNFLKPYAHVIDTPQYIDSLSLYIMPYHHDVKELAEYIKPIHNSYPILLHQGLVGSHMGDYIVDKSALSPTDVAGKRIIASHYHARQTIKLPNGGVWDFIGNPYTVSYGEANDLEKGFQILYNDGSLEFVPTNLRKHIVTNVSANAIIKNHPLTQQNNQDLIWIKVHGTHEELNGITRGKIASLIGTDIFKLDLIPTEVLSQSQIVKPSTQPELLDSIIDSLSNTTEERKQRLKDLWRNLV